MKIQKVGKCPEHEKGVQTDTLRVGKCYVCSEVGKHGEKVGGKLWKLDPEQGEPGNQMRVFRLYLLGRKSHWKCLHKGIKVGFRNINLQQLAQKNIWREEILETETNEQSRELSVYKAIHA